MSALKKKTKKSVAKPAAKGRPAAKAGKSAKPAARAVRPARRVLPAVPPLKAKSRGEKAAPKPM
ncbi:MAG: hypothetical protein RL303_1299, partial [Verrucomicrobiota bacterium]